MAALTVAGPSEANLVFRGVATGPAGDDPRGSQVVLEADNRWAAPVGGTRWSWCGERVGAAVQPAARTP